MGIADEMRPFAEWMAAGATSAGYEFDFSVASGAEIDRFVSEQSKKPGKAKRKGLLSEDLGQRLLGIGAYTGEVIRTADPRWAWVGDDEDPRAEITVQLVRGDEVIWPVQRAMKRFQVGPEEGVQAYIQAILDTD